MAVNVIGGPLGKLTRLKLIPSGIDHEVVNLPGRSHTLVFGPGSKPFKWEAIQALSYDEAKGLLTLTLDHNDRDGRQEYRVHQQQPDQLDVANVATSSVEAVKAWFALAVVEWKKSQKKQ